MYSEHKFMYNTVQSIYNTLTTSTLLTIQSVWVVSSQRGSI